jgi:hypothetical protein
VAAELVAAEGELAQRFTSLRGGQWQRPDRRRDGARFTIDTFPATSSATP